MTRVKFLGFGFIVAMALAVVNSCGVPAPFTPSATAEPADGSAITSTDAIIISFDTSMVPGSLSLYGDMLAESDRGVWFQNKSANDTLVIRPSFAHGGVWAAGLHTLTIDVEASSGVALETMELNYTIEATVPTVAFLSPDNTSTIIGSTQIVIVFNVEMDPLTLSLSGNMAAVSDGGVWSRTTNDNDTLVISSSSVWNNTTDNLIIDVGSIEGAPLSTLSLFYTVDVEVPVVESVVPASTSAIQGSTQIVISFSLGMDLSTLNVTGSMVDEGADAFWSSITNAFDTLTIVPKVAWSDGPHTMSIDAKAFNGFSIATENLSYDVDATLSVPVVTPASSSRITSGEVIVIDFGEEMDIATLVASGTLWGSRDSSIVDPWSATNSILTIKPGILWPEGPIALTLDIVDFVGNSIATLILNYTVDVAAPTVETVIPVSTSNLYNVNASAEADTIVITYSEQMNTGSLSLLGDMKDESDSILWSNTTDDNDTLTISTSTAWITGLSQALDVSVSDVAGNTVTENLVYDVYEKLCGDGDVTVPEECDDAGESATCNDICTVASCGDGITNVTASEVCDAAGESVSCDSDCTSVSCGDGTLNMTAGETCDDGGESASCDSDCTSVSCGDGTLNATAGETCDDGGESASCDSDCTSVSCGDGTLNTTSSEACDDGNLINGDGCSDLCLIE